MQSSSRTSGPSSSFVAERLSQPVPVPPAGKSPLRRVTAGIRSTSLVTAAAGSPPAPTPTRPASLGSDPAPVSQHLDRLSLRQPPATDSKAERAPVAGAQLQQASLDLAIDCLAGTRTPKTQDQLYRLFDKKQMDAFFDQEIAARYGRCGLPVPDPVNDSPQAFVSKCLAIDRSGRATDRCTSHLLERALDTGNVPVTFTLLKGLQWAMKRGSLERHDLEDQHGRTLLEGTLFYEKLSRDWCRLVLAARVFDIHSDSMPPLCRAAVLSRDAAALEALLEAGADPCVADDIMGHLPQALCAQSFCRAGREKMEALLQHPRVNPNQISGEGSLATTALHEAASGGKVELVDRLLRHDAIDRDVFCPTAWGSPLAAAVVQFLLKPNTPDTMARFLAEEGARLLIASAEGDPIDCGYDISRFQKLFGSSAIKAVAPERTRQLQAALDQGRKTRLRQAVHKGRRKSEYGTP